MAAAPRNLAAAHMNGFVRFKLAVTEDRPEIKTYEEDLWGSHPQRGLLTIDKAIQLYAWHGPHHTAHITNLRARKGW
jgi:hypothetical protein